MRILLKYFFWLLSLLSVLVYYFFGTTLGNVSVGNLVEEYYNKKTNDKIEVLSLNIKGYPNTIVADIKVNDDAMLSIKGKADQEDMNISYHLKGDSFKWGSYNIAQPLDVKGRMKGKISALLIEGAGDIFEGDTSYSFMQTTSRLEDLKVKLNSVNSEPLLKFFKYDFKIKGDVDVFMEFEYFSSFRKKGFSKISMNGAKIPKFSKKLEFALDAQIKYRDMFRDFSLDIHSDIGKLRIANGYYNKSAGIIKAEYGLNIKELAYFEDLLGHKYKGKLNTAGDVSYEAKKLSLVGDTGSYGGLLKYDYKNDYLELNLKGVALEKILPQLSFPVLLNSKVYGTASYDLKEKIVLVNTKLKETRFRRTKMTDTIYDVTKIDILKDVYNNSLFTAGYQDSVLTSFLQIDNGVNHLYLKDTRMNSKTNEITADFEVLIDEQEFLGEIYGTLENPKIDLDMSELIKYQVHKKIENFFGKGKPLNKKNTQIKVDEIKNNLNHKIKQKTRTFLDGFFD